MRQVALKRVARVAVSNVDKKTVDDQERIRLCNYTDVYYNPVITDRLDFMEASASDEQIATFSLRAGDVLITKDSETTDDIGVPARVPFDVAGVLCGYHLALIRPDVAQIDGSYLYWVLASTSTRRRFAVDATGVTRFGLRSDSILNVPVPLPRLDQQRAIAGYLDAETARIDALITKKRRLIDLLDARTESLISATLDPLIDASGEVPLKSMAELRVSSVDKKSYEGERRVRLCNYTDVYYNRRVSSALDFTEATAATRQAERLELRSGDVLITKDSETADDIAVPALVIEDLPGVVLGYHLAMLRPQAIEGAFLYWVLRSRRCRDAFSLAASGVTRFGLRQDDVRRVPVPNLARKSQRTAVDQIETGARGGENVVAALTRQINLLTEHRQALITAAVTGETSMAALA